MERKKERASMRRRRAKSAGEKAKNKVNSLYFSVKKCSKNKINVK